MTRGRVPQLAEVKAQSSYFKVVGSYPAAVLSAAGSIGNASERWRSLALAPSAARWRWR